MRPDDKGDFVPTYMTYLIVAAVSVAVGYVGFLVILKILPGRQKADHKRQYDDIVAEARQQAVARRQSEVERLEEERQLMLEQLEANISERHEDLKLTEEDLAAREHTLEFEEGRLAKSAKELEAHEQKVEAARQAHAVRLTEIKEAQTALRTSLETLAGVDSNNLSRSIKDNLIESRRIECQKTLKFLDEELGASSKRLAQRVLARGMARYAPDFAWPKTINVVEVEDQKLAERIMGAEGEALIAAFKEKAEIEIEILTDPNHPLPLLKLAGGAGINREAVRLAFTDLLPKGAGAWAKPGAFYDKFRAQLEQEAVLLGRQAVHEVGIEGLHPEVQRLVGYLNWRTSYRQNQWYHTVEVAKLAGIIAAEMGVDVDQAKRVGLLHDIGKAIDYRIEGSHAVISGDYADRFGENRIVCDTVMSHHNDLVIETPLAFVLKTADTLSGARPGARVNLEEGYQLRLSGIESAVRHFPGVMNISIMNGGREVHVEVNNKRVSENELEAMSQGIARKIEADVAYPGEIKVLVTRRFEATAVA
jgi:ribonuclease Y